MPTSTVSDVHRAGPSLPVLLALAQPVQSDRSLDVATGTGHTALAVARFVAKTIGIDIAPKMLEQARRLAVEQGVSNCTFMEGAAERMPLADGQFTLVTARHAPHHFHHAPYRLEFDWWVKQAGCDGSAISALIEHAAHAPQQVRNSLELEFDPTGLLISFQEPMLVVRMEKLS